MSAIRDIVAFPVWIGHRNQLLVKVTTEDGLYGWGESGFVFLPESDRNQSRLSLESGGFCFPVQPGVRARHFYDLDFSLDGYRLYLREQGETRNCARHCFRLVADYHAGCGGVGRQVLVAGTIPSVGRRFQ